MAAQQKRPLSVQAQRETRMQMTRSTDLANLIRAAAAAPASYYYVREAGPS
jgi:hypothetical protein